MASNPRVSADVDEPGYGPSSTSPRPTRKKRSTKNPFHQLMERASQPWPRLRWIPTGYNGCMASIGLITIEVEDHSSEARDSSFWPSKPGPERVGEMGNIIVTLATDWEGSSQSIFEVDIPLSKEVCNASEKRSVVLIEDRWRRALYSVLAKVSRLLEKATSDIAKLKEPPPIPLKNRCLASLGGSLDRSGTPKCFCALRKGHKSENHRGSGIYAETTWAVSHHRMDH